MHCSCGTKMHHEFDRYRCLICGHSVWHEFKTRRPTAADKNPTQPPRVDQKGKVATGGTSIFK